MGIQHLASAFSKDGPASFVGYLTAGYPNAECTIPAMVAMQGAGASVIEVGVPFSDPLADGPTIQMASTVALEQGMTLPKVLELVAGARAQGVTIPIVLMGYFNPFLAYGIEAIARDAAKVGVDGFIIVDLPPEEGDAVLAALQANDLSFVPLITPTTAKARIPTLARVATSFVYIVSVAGVTGARSQVSESLPALLAEIRAHTDLPLAVGFGVSQPEHVRHIASLGAAGVVVGSAIVKAVAEGDGDPKKGADKVGELVKSLVEATPRAAPRAANASPANPDADEEERRSLAEFYSRGKFGDFGGCFIPETLVKAHRELWAEFNKAIADPAFLDEIAYYRKQYVGGPTPVYHAKRLSELCGGAQIWCKREDLAHTGAHKINNSLGQALLVKRMGKKRVIAETGAGQHGVATATACALMGLECVVYMGAEDIRRQSLNVFRMKLLGATVCPVSSGSQTLKDAINEAMRDWVTNVETTHYIVGSAIGPHPFPTIVKFFQSVIGSEAREQMQQATGKLPDAVVACVGGGSNAIGTFAPFAGDEGVRLVGVEAGGEKGFEGAGAKHSATLCSGKPGVLHGTFTFLQQDADGQIVETHSISAGLDYPGVGPEHAFLKVSGRAQYVAVTDGQALEGLKALASCEGILAALETSHAVYHTMQLAKELGKDKVVMVTLSGRGDKDMVTVAKALGYTLGVDV